MSKLPLDLSKFRKVKADEKTTTFQHKDGHVINIAHSKLSPKFKSQLEKLPVSYEHAQKFADGSPNVQSNPVQTEPDEFDVMTKTLNPINFFKGDPQAQQLAYNQAQENLPKTADEEAAREQAISTPKTNADQLPLQQAAAVPQDGLASSNQDTTSSSNTDQYGLASSLGLQKEALQHEQSYRDLLAEAQGAVGFDQAQAEKQYQTNIANIQTQNDAAIKPFMDQSIALNHAIANGQLNPQHYIQSMSTGDKISTGIGLILGGMGSGLTGGPNLAMNYLSNQIDHDIDSQKNDLGRKENLLSHNIQLMGSVRAGTEMTRMQQYQILQSRLNQAAQQQGGNIAASQAGIMNSQIDGKIGELQRQGALFHMIDQGGNNQSPQAPAQQLRLMKMANMIDDKQYEQGNKELGQAQELMKLKADLHGSYDDLNNSFLAGKFSPVDRQSAIDTFAGRLGKTTEGRYNEDAAKNQFNAIMPTGFEGGQTRVNKLTRMDQLIDSQVNTPTLDGLNVRVPDPTKMRKTAQSQYKISGGVKYMRGPNGEAIQVK